MRVVAAAVIMAFLAGPAIAQERAVPKYGEEDKDKTPAQKRAEKDAEAAYTRSLGNISAPKPVDPWGNVRSDNTQKETKAPAAKKAKTGSSSN
jgi:hypothetical protein